MFLRRREQLVLILGAMIINAALLWYLFGQVKDYQARTQWMHNRVTPAEGVNPQTSASGHPENLDFSDLVARDLFSPDRSGSAPTAPAKMPALPVFYGSMNLGDGAFALMAPGDQPTAASERVFPGDEIGGFKLVSIAGSQAVVVWQDKKVTLDVEDSMRRMPPVGGALPSPAGPSAVGAGAATGGPNVTTVGGSGSAGASSNGFAGFNAPPGVSPDAPVGTIVGGKQKVVIQTMFGPSVWWKDVQPSTKQQ